MKLVDGFSVSKTLRSQKVQEHSASDGTYHSPLFLEIYAGFRRAHVVRSKHGETDVIVHSITLSLTKNVTLGIGQGFGLEHGGIVSVVTQDVNPSDLLLLQNLVIYIYGQGLLEVLVS